MSERKCPFDDECMDSEDDTRTGDDTEWDVDAIIRGLVQLSGATEGTLAGTVADFVSLALYIAEAIGLDRLSLPTHGPRQSC